MRTEDIAKPHIESYNALFKSKIFKNIIKGIRPLVIEDFRLEITDYNIHQPYVAAKNNISIDRRLLPRECRMTNTTYKGRLYLKFNLYFKNQHVLTELRPCGYFPTMVKSGFCHLLDEEDLSKIDEDDNDIGGYFIINGIDKMVRFHIMQKRNYCFSLIRPQKNKLYTDTYIYIRSVGGDELGQVNYLHYSVDGDVYFRFFRKRNEFHVPVVIILKALINTSDEEIYKLVGKDPYSLVFLSKSRTQKVFSMKECQEYIGARFKQIINSQTNLEACSEILEDYILPHLKDKRDKFLFIIEAIKKLFKLIRGEIISDDADSPASHELLTETQLFANIFRDKIEELKKNFNSLYFRSLNRQKNKRKHDNGENQTQGVELFLHAYKFLDTSNIGRGFESFLSTGNINIQNSSDILQNGGFCIIAERINFYRYISHFRSVNRGSFFQEVRTTGVRKLRSESWGFFCPVHTPDGTPCGLLTHLSSGTSVVSKDMPFDTNILYSYGVIPPYRNSVDGVPVFYNGRLVGYCNTPIKITKSLRSYRREKNLDIEIVHYYGTKLYESIYIYSSISRLTRPIKHMESGLIEYIGIMEQVFLNIELCKKNEIKNSNNNNIENGNNNMEISNDTNLKNSYITLENSNKEFEYEEVDTQNIFSIVASLTPFSEYNQSPRNMYQCQMAKQSMGVPAHNIKTRSDTKMYMLNYTHHPIVRTRNYDLVSAYPLGLNCIVAVLSYTAYDMEDAMVINKGSMERGLFCGYVYKEDKVVLPKDCYFSFLPEVGHAISSGDILYKYMDLCGKETVVKCTTFDGYLVESIDIFENDTVCANIKFRIVRNPNIGDKFCSRHGQKGVCSMHWPTVDMPFSESGIVPDIIINPHAFPSRMTIGMMLESMSGKVGCCLGKPQDATTFEKNTYFDVDMTSSDTKNDSKSIGDQLLKHGFNYAGNEPMYSGVTGNEFRTDIFIGVVFYQRLRHMVNDKFQVRTSGAVVATTRQPVGGRKNLGGVRFGEMERDAMISHGTPYLLNDRLLKCSDSTLFTYCYKCKSVLFTNNNKCVCGGRIFSTIEMPYVFRYLCTELLAMNIRVVIDAK